MFGYLYESIERNFRRAVFGLFVILVIDILVFSEIAEQAVTKGKLSLYFLPVGQGDSELAILPGGVKLLVDGGPPDSAVLRNLDGIFSPRDRYVDLVILTHPQQDHFGGLIEVLKRYRVGAFIWNGEMGTNPAMRDLLGAVEENGAPEIALSAGDRIVYGESKADILSPVLMGKADVNEDALVFALESGGVKAFFASDIGAKTEKRIITDNPDITNSIDILKVGHNGSKNSSSATFLGALKPKAAVIEVGKNSYGHPTPEVLDRLAEIGARVFRTDRDGLLKFELTSNALRILKIP